MAGRLLLQQKIEMQQKLAMSPQMLQALGLLQLPVMELSTALQTELQENPLLEMADDHEDDHNNDYEGSSDWRKQDEGVAGMAGMTGSAGSAQNECGGATGEGEFSEGPSQGLTLSGEWDPEAYYAGETGDGEGASMLSGRVRGLRAEAQEGVQIENLAAPTYTLLDDLRLQLYGSDLNERERKIGAFLIDCLDENGYLREDCACLAKALAAGHGAAGDDVAGHCAEADAADIERVLEVLKSFEPAGVFASNLQECMLLQIERRGWTDTVAGRIIRDHFDLLSSGRFSEIAAVLRVSRETVLDAVAQIRQLEPRPGASGRDSASTVPYPDLTILERDGRWEVVVNESPYPRLKLSPYYYGLLQSNPEDPKLKAYLREKAERAQWILKAIGQRRATLLKIGYALLELQPAFFRQGPAALKVMTQADVAEIVDVHVSTVSRAVAGKYVQTPFGLFALRDLFQSGVDTRTGGDRASGSVKRMLREIIASEDPKHPLNDEQLAAALKKAGLVISRRTVTKYRLELAIPAARLRIK